MAFLISLVLFAAAFVYASVLFLPSTWFGVEAVRQVVMGHLLILNISFLAAAFLSALIAFGTIFTTHGNTLAFGSKTGLLMLACGAVAIAAILAYQVSLIFF